MVHLIFLLLRSAATPSEQNQFLRVRMKGNDKRDVFLPHRETFFRDFFIYKSSVPPPPFKVHPRAVLVQCVCKDVHIKMWLLMGGEGILKIMKDANVTLFLTLL